MPSAKMATPRVGTTAPMVRLLPELRARAAASGAKPSARMARRTLAWRAGLTSLGLLSTRDTVAGETPAARATSASLGFGRKVVSIRAALDAAARNVVRGR